MIEICHQQHLSNSAPVEWLLKETIDTPISANDCLVLLPFDRIKNPPWLARVDNRQDARSLQAETVRVILLLAE